MVNTRSYITLDLTYSLVNKKGIPMPLISVFKMAER